MCALDGTMYKLNLFFSRKNTIVTDGGCNLQALAAAPRKLSSRGRPHTKPIQYLYRYSTAQQPFPLFHLERECTVTHQFRRLLQLNYCVLSHKVAFFIIIMPLATNRQNFNSKIFRLDNDS
jgi:hypothetical protein